MRAEAPGRGAVAAERAGAAAALVLLACGCAGEAAAQDAARRFELTPHAGFGFGGRFEEENGPASVRLGDDTSVGLLLDIREAADTQWEVLYSRQDTTADTSALAGFAPETRVRMHYLQGGGTYQWPGETARPYLAATVGATRIAPSAPGLAGDTFPSLSVGLGLAIRAHARLGIRLEARVFGTLVDSDTGLFCESGAGGAACAIEVDGRVLWQIETFAGLVLRF